MHGLSYESVAVDGLSPQEIKNILQTAAEFNSAVDITGCLIYHNT